MTAETVSLSDTINEAYDAVLAGETPAEGEPLEIDAPQESVAEVAVDAAESTQPERQTDPAEGVAPEPAKTVASEPGKDPVEAKPEDAAPSSWKRDVASKWAELPAEIRAEVQRRENDYHKSVSELKQDAGIGRTMVQAITPYAENIRSAGVDVPTAITKLLQADHTLRNGDPQTKMQFLAQMAQDYGIPLADVAKLPEPDPSMVALRRRVEDAENRAMQFQREQQQAQQTALETEIQRFAADPAHPHFEAVKSEMGSLLQSGMVQTLQEAYDKAVWMRDDLRKSLLDQERAAAAQGAITQTQAARRAKAAGSVTGSAPSAVSAIKPGSSIRDILSASLNGEQ